MKHIIFYGLILGFLSNIAFAQEWKNLRAYKKETGKTELEQGHWLRKDRKLQNGVWSNANKYNLTLQDGFTKYENICQIHDFYVWFDCEREKQGHEIKWIGIAAVASGQFSKLDNGFIRFVVVHNKEVVDFVFDASDSVLAFAFPILKEVYFSSKPIKGEMAEKWTNDYGKHEQCDVLDPMYARLSPKALQKLEFMAKGKGLFRFGVPKVLKYEGSLSDCQDRVEHGLNKILPYYLSNSNKNKEN